MNCPVCNADTGVVDSRPGLNNTVWRRRQCLFCKHRFTTTEIVAEELATMRAFNKATLEHRERLRVQINAPWPGETPQIGENDG